MTKPTITHGHGHLNDCDDASGLAANHSADPLTNPTCTVLHGDIYQIEGTCDAVADEYVSYTEDFTPNISSDVYTKYVVRWKTSESANGLGAVAQIFFADLSWQAVVGATNPEYSTTWKVSSGTITPSKTIEKIVFAADDYPNSIAAGTFQVYFDFFLLHKNVFTLPFVSGTEGIELLNNLVYLKSPSRVGNITQNLGADSPIIRLSGKMDDDTGWRGSSGAGIHGEDLYNLWLGMKDDPFQWLTTDLLGALGGCKVTVPRLAIRKVPGSKSKRMWSVDFRHYSLSSGDADSWTGLDWLGAKET